MKSAAVISVLALVAGVAAHEHNHGRFHQERAVAAKQDDAQCVLTVVTVTSTGEWKLVQETAAPVPTSTSTSSSSSSSTSTSSSSAAPPPPPTYAAQPTTTVNPPAAYVAPAANTPAAAAPAVAVNTPAPASSPAQSNSGSCSAAIAPAGDKWAFCYTPYTSSGGCKSADEVYGDLSSLKGKGFNTIRTYANDCSGLANIGSAARSLGLKLLVGINIDGSGIGSYTDGQIAALKSWAQWDLVSMVIAGNEAVFNGWASAGALAGFIGTVKSELKSAGYCGPVTTAETLNVIQENADAICGAVDVIGANIHPFFNTDVSAIIAGPFAATQLAGLAAACHGSKPAYILEIGWPSAGSSNGLAIPGFDAQRIAISGIVGAVGSKAAVFSYENDNWKAPGAWGVEQHWGCSGLF